MESYNLWLCLAGLFCSTCFWSSFILKHASIFYSFLWLNIISLDGYTTFVYKRGGAVKALSPKARPICDRQVVPTEGGLRGSLLHAVPVPWPVVRTPPPRPLDADPWGPRSARTGRSKPPIHLWVCERQGSGGGVWRGSVRQNVPGITPTLLL